MALKKITGKDFKEALDALTPYGEGDVVWLKELGKTDGGTGLYLIVGWTRDLGYELSDVEANGFTGDNDDYIGYKIGYFNYKPGIRYMLQDFDDFHMPYNLKDDKANGIYSGDVWDTDGYLSNEPSSWDSLALQLNGDAQGIWDTWGENGELDLMESNKKEAKKHTCSMQKKESLAKKSEARNSGWSEEDSEMYAQGLDSDTTLEDIKDALKDEPYFEENPEEIDEVATEIFDYIPKGEKNGESKKSETYSDFHLSDDDVKLIVNYVDVDEHGGSFSVDTPKDGQTYSLEDMKDMIKGMCDDCTGYADISRDGSDILIIVNAPEMDENGEWSGNYYDAMQVRCSVRVMSTSLESFVDYLDKYNEE